MSKMFRCAHGTISKKKDLIFVENLNSNKNELFYFFLFMIDVRPYSTKIQTFWDVKYVYMCI